MNIQTEKLAGVLAVIAALNTPWAVSSAYEANVTPEDLEITDGVHETKDQRIYSPFVDRDYSGITLDKIPMAKPCPVQRQTVQFSRLNITIPRTIAHGLDYEGSTTVIFRIKMDRDAVKDGRR